MLTRINTNWVYGGVMAGILLLVIAPLTVPALSDAGRLVYFALVAYMFHQYEEHDDDRFRRYANTTVAAGRAGLTHSDVFLVNVPGVWGVMAVALWLAERASPGWAMIAAWLMLVNALAHVLPAVKMRQPNPGLWSAIVLFVPFGVWMLVRLWSATTATEQVVSVALVIAIHIAIMVRALRPARATA